MIELLYIGQLNRQKFQGTLIEFDVNPVIFISEYVLNVGNISYSTGSRDTEW